MSGSPTHSKFPQVVALHQMIAAQHPVKAGPAAAAKEVGSDQQAAVPQQVAIEQYYLAGGMTLNNIIFPNFIQPSL